MVIDNEKGSVKIADEVVSVIAGLAASEVSGVAGMSGGIAGGISEILGRKNLSKGVKVQINEKDAVIDVYLIVNYGVRIPEVAWKVQENVKKAVENMTGLNVSEVNIHIQGINFEQTPKEQPK
ncbi:Asp23/Gls24 family envelope stress response protein [Thermovenabulum gondwanense]|uniref:Alkaline shock protein 23 n=1 Tax=Thermovenabulum gondwanense TaxID=520767 RepID=A0A162MGT0_9FIRM|nr:Asp23/Gls24 family envelope stress response protein [Thermovenabulum gondwanense]KYO65819.1 Alkaline shock protein 23 [Thermovenabulum gondwanense]